MKNKPLLFCALLWGAFSSLIAQTPADSLMTKTDSLTLAPPPKRSSLTDKIVYSADHYTISLKHNRIYLTGNAQIKYETMTLTAERIIIDKEKNKLYASGVADSVDANGKPVLRGTPVFTEKGQPPMYGRTIEYDLNTQRGKIEVGRTDMDPGHYKGEHIYKVADSTLFVRDGYFTTCDLPDNPHFYFKSDEMRIKVRDRVVARPIYFYLADIPLAAVPFGIFPNKSGRQSGILLPSYGESRTGGRFLRGFGYYWAPNDYFDGTIITDFYDKLGFTYRANMNYKIRYLLNGKVSGEYYPVDPATGQKRERWRFNFSHNQNIDPSFSISGYGSFQSDKDLQRDVSPNVNDRLNQLITSNLTLSKRFERSSINVSLSRTENLQTDESSYILPRVSYSTRKTTLFQLFTGQKPAAGRDWYQNIYLDYSSQAIGKGSRTRRVVRGDSTTADSIYFVDQSAYGIKHNVRLSMAQKAGYFNFTPSLNFDEVWTDEITVGRYDPATGAIIREQKKQFAARHTFNASVGMRTRLYGLFEPNIGDLKYIRHVIDPGINYSITPDFSDERFGYFTYVDTGLGRVAIDKFQKSPYGATRLGKSQRMNLSLNNRFQGKSIDEEGNEKKFDILQANFSTSYNFLADTYKWGNISSNYTTRVLGKTLNARATHSIYALGADGKTDGRTLIFDKGQWLPRLTSFSTSLSFRLDQKVLESFQGTLQKKSDVDSVAADSLDLELPRANITNSNLRREKQAAKKIKLPWSMAFNLSYSYNRPGADAGLERISLTSTADFKLTENWKIRWRANFDLVRKEMVYQNIDIYRDLHCWEMSFNWQPLKGYYSLQINIKEPTLKDIKLTKYNRNSSLLQY